MPRLQVGAAGAQRFTATHPRVVSMNRPPGTAALLTNAAASPAAAAAAFGRPAAGRALASGQAASAAAPKAAGSHARDAAGTAASNAAAGEGNGLSHLDLEGSLVQTVILAMQVSDPMRCLADSG